MVKKHAREFLLKGNNAIDGVSYKLINALNAFKRYRNKKVNKISGKQRGKGSRVFRRRQRGGAIGAGLALGLALPMITQGTQGILNSKVF